MCWHFLLPGISELSSRHLLLTSKGQLGPPEPGFNYKAFLIPAQNGWTPPISHASPDLQFQWPCAPSFGFTCSRKLIISVEKGTKISKGVIAGDFGPLGYTREVMLAYPWIPKETAGSWLGLSTCIQTVANWQIWPSASFWLLQWNPKQAHQASACESSKV